MRNYTELNELEQKAAIEQALTNLIEAVTEGALRFNDSLNQDDLQARIDRAFAKAERLRTPWFLGEILLDDAVIRDALTGMATCDAEDAIYLESFEPTPIRLKKGAI